MFGSCWDWCAGGGQIPGSSPDAGQRARRARISHRQKHANVDTSTRAIPKSWASMPTAIPGAAPILLGETPQYRTEDGWMQPHSCVRFGARCAWRRNIARLSAGPAARINDLRAGGPSARIARPSRFEAGLLTIPPRRDSTPLLTSLLARSFALTVHRLPWRNALLQRDGPGSFQTLGIVDPPSLEVSYEPHPQKHPVFTGGLS
jgi:hypothetical protein